MIRRRSKPRRVSVARDKRYLSYLQGCGCAVCHYGPSDAAHCRTNGLSSKGSDLKAIPLCRAHHNEQHRVGWPAFCKKYGLNHAAAVAHWNLEYTLSFGEGNK